MNIGIIGSGNLGSIIARALSASGHRVKIANSRSRETLVSFANNIGATAASSLEAVIDVDVVILSVPEKAIPLLPPILFANAPKKLVVVDTGNYYPTLRDGPIEAIDTGLPESVWVSEQVKWPIIKTFNSILANSLMNKGQKESSGSRIALPVAGNDIDSKSVVMSLVGDTGFDSLDAGSLNDSWRQQPGTPAYCTDLSRDNLRRALLNADRESASSLREQTIQLFTKLGRHPTNDELLEIHRSVHYENASH